MINRKDNHQSQGKQRRKAIKEHPEHVVKNPAMQYYSGHADESLLNNPGNTPGGTLGNTEDIPHQTHETYMRDFNKTGGIRNQGANEQNSSDHFKNNTRPRKKYSGKEGKTMVKNVGMNEFPGEEIV